MSILSYTLKHMQLPTIIFLLFMGLSIFGLVSIPGGMNPNTGLEYNLSYLEAFYIMTYTATTIGYGEIPYPFSIEQKLYMSFMIYVIVFIWFYFLSSIVEVFKKKEFKELIEIKKINKLTKTKSKVALIYTKDKITKNILNTLENNKYQIIILHLDSATRNQNVFNTESNMVFNLSNNINNFKKLFELPIDVNLFVFNSDMENINNIYNLLSLHYKKIKTIELNFGDDINITTKPIRIKEEINNHLSLNIVDYKKMFLFNIFETKEFFKINQLKKFYQIKLFDKIEEGNFNIVINDSTIEVLKGLKSDYKDTEKIFLYNPQSRKQTRKEDKKLDIILNGLAFTIIFLVSNNEIDNLKHYMELEEQDNVFFVLKVHKQLFKTILDKDISEIDNLLIIDEDDIIEEQFNFKLKEDKSIDFLINSIKKKEGLQNTIIDFMIKSKKLLYREVKIDINKAPEILNEISKNNNFKIVDFIDMNYCLPLMRVRRNKHIIIDNNTTIKENDIIKVIIEENGVGILENILVDKKSLKNRLNQNII